MAKVAIDRTDGGDVPRHPGKDGRETWWVYKADKEVGTCGYTFWRAIQALDRPDLIQYLHIVAPAEMKAGMLRWMLAPDLRMWSEAGLAFVAPERMQGTGGYESTIEPGET